MLLAHSTHSHVLCPMQLSDLTGIPGCIFVHAGGFIGGNDTKEGVMAMARKALA